MAGRQSVKPKVAVIGCGVSGLSSGIRLLEAGFPVRVMARDFPPHTTSDVAAAIWYPYLAAPKKKVSVWACQTFDALCALARNPETGVSLVTLHQVFDQPAPDPWWKDDRYAFERLSGADLPVGRRDGYRLKVPFMETPRYMPYLMRRFRLLGGEVERREIADLDGLHTRYPLVVNCTGLGAAQLAGDPSLFPIKGQVLRVTAPSGTPYMADDSNEQLPIYILPRRSDCILGGTALSGDASLKPDPQATERILAECKSLAPELAGARLLEVKVGLRPGRERIRLECCPLSTGRGATIHNYGHGGAGLTLSWGCADEVASLALSFWKRLCR